MARTRPKYVIDGPRWFRTEIRHKGPFAALIVPFVLGVIALVCLRVFDSKITGQLGIVAAFCAAPALPMMGSPFSSTQVHPLAIGGSAVIWLVVGYLAARRATRDPMADWSDYWRNYRWLAGGIWVGCLVTLAVIRFGVGANLL